MFGDEPDALLGDGLAILCAQYKGAVREKAVGRDRLLGFGIPHTAQQAAAAWISRDRNQDTGTTGDLRWIIRLPVTLRTPFHSERRLNQPRILGGGLKKLNNLWVSREKALDLDLAENLFKLLKGQGMTTTH